MRARSNGSPMLQIGTSNELIPVKTHERTWNIKGIGTFNEPILVKTREAMRNINEILNIYAERNVVHIEL